MSKVLIKKTKFPAMYIYPQTLTERTLEKAINTKNIEVKR